MKTTKCVNPRTSMSLFATLAIVMAKGAEAEQQKSPAASHTTRKILPRQ